MDIKAYVYIDSHEGIMCFQCAVKEIVNLELAKAAERRHEKFLLKKSYYDLTLEMGTTGSGCDMRSIPRCLKCNKRIENHCIA